MHACDIELALCSRAASELGHPVGAWQKRRVNVTNPMNNANTRRLDYRFPLARKTLKTVASGKWIDAWPRKL